MAKTLAILRMPAVPRIFIILSILTTALYSQSTETVVHSFIGSDGCAPSSGVVFDSTGNLFGTTETGGLYDMGTVFELTPSTGGWTETTLYNFGASVEDGSYPVGGLTFDTSGNLYGTTRSGGGNPPCPSGCGTVFRLSPGVNGWTETARYGFQGGNGNGPVSGVTIDGTGNVFGMTNIGGSDGDGTVFELQGSRIKVLHSFTGSSDGAIPYDGVTLDSAGNLYGTTSGGGDYTFGVVFQLVPTAKGWHEEVLHSFQRVIGIGGVPEGGIILDAAGNIYGTTATGSDKGKGGVFELKRVSSGKRQYSILFGFSGGADGGFPAANLTLDALGNLYGTTTQGGQGNFGTVFKLAPTASGLWTETVLHRFTGGMDGNNPAGSGVVLDPMGNLYGTTFYGGNGCGVVFEITP